MRRRLVPLLLSLCSLLGTALPAAAQAPAFTQVRGAVQSLDGGRLTVADAGKATVVNLAPNWTVTVLKNIDPGQIQPGSFIGTTNRIAADGSGVSTEVHVFPPGVRLGEGHYPWGDSGSMMTNGDVTMVVTGARGRELEIKYPSGVHKVTVPEGTPVVSFTPGEQAMIKPGLPVFILAVPGPDGALAAQGVTIGENGAAPPM